MGSGKRSGRSVSIRVHDVIRNCAGAGHWADFPDSLGSYFVFIPKPTGGVNLATCVMANVPRKHVGIYCTGRI